jgi:hypothetical protein
MAQPLFYPYFDNFAYVLEELASIFAYVLEEKQLKFAYVLEKYRKRGCANVRGVAQPLLIICYVLKGY